MEGNYNRLLIGLLITIIPLLTGDIILLNQQISDMAHTIDDVNQKLDQLEKLVESGNADNKVIRTGNKWVIGSIVVITVMVALIYFGGIDPGNLGNLFNSTADQTVELINSQNNLDAEHFKTLLEGQKNISSLIVDVISRKNDLICEKIDNIMLNMMKSIGKVDLNNIFSLDNSNSKDDWT
jgi:hypothetical protein